MRLYIPRSVLKVLTKQELSGQIVLEQMTLGYISDTESLTSHTLLDLAGLKTLRGACKRVEDRAARGLGQKLQALINIAEDTSKTFTDLSLLTESIREYFKTLPHHWMFRDSLPYLATGASYHPPRQEGETYTPGYISISSLAIERGSYDSSGGRLDKSMLDGEAVNAQQALSLARFIPETPELVAQYEASMERYVDLRMKVGIQLSAAGLATSAEKNRWYSSEAEVHLDKEGQPGRLILDDDVEWGSSSKVYQLDLSFTDTNQGGSRNHRSYSSETEEQDRKCKVVNLPEHPYIRAFDLRNFLFVRTHVDNVDQYVYDRRAFDRVVLPEDVKEIIDAMVQSGSSGDDIIAGKGRGVVILSSGSPGTGKTLTSEAYAERAKKPLYSVQCSQLGMDPKTIEEELSQFLNRCNKWGAIGLIDEADVFVRSRGDDLTQNAIVGVFLRVLEYYRGVLFLTTNRAGLVDDAVLSRCVIHVKYKVPDKDQARVIWSIMFNQFGIYGSKEHIKPPKSGEDPLIDSLVKEFEGISGRTIKQLCRLGRTMVDRGRTLSLETFKWVARFQDLETNSKD